jgi:lipoyl(octanoyl) transferase
LNRLRFIRESEFPGPLNMALDYYLASSLLSSSHDYTLRLYKWNRPTLSCGFHQNIERRVNLEKCKEANVDVVRRPTGGRELMHDGDISFSITGKADGNGLSDKNLFNKTGQVVLGGLKAVGIEAKLIASPKKAGVISQGPCLAAISQYEIVVGGRKIVPVAQRVYKDSVLIHGSIPIRSSKISTAELLNVSDPQRLQKILDELAIDLEEVSGGGINLDQFRDGLIASFCESFEGECELMELGKSEIEEASKTLNNWMIMQI